jgi:hypothetical protein
MKPAKEILSDTAKKGAKESNGKFGKMCSECAFKKGGAANNEPHNVDAALNCLAYGGRFHCHAYDENGVLIDGGKPCVGFQYAEYHVNSLG